MDFIGDIWDFIVDTFEYIISFEWLGDIWDFVSGMFEDLGEFSMGGLIFGVLALGIVYGLRDYLLNPFLVHMSPSSALFWGGANYIVSLAGGYLIGKRLFDD